MSEHVPDFHDEEMESEKPLFKESCGGSNEEFFYDEDGSLTLAGPTIGQPIAQPKLPTTVIPVTRPCSLATLDGSWLFEIDSSASSYPVFLFPSRGPMRIEAANGVLRVSGDVYTRGFFLQTAAAAKATATSISSTALVIRRNWYPAYPQREYRWYFRSLGVSYSNGILFFQFERHLWSNSAQEFVSTDTGWMRFECRQSIFQLAGWPQPTIKMKGTASIGGKTYNVTATKTSPYYRGCLVEVDVMTNRQWPSSASSCNGSQSFTFTGVYRSSGMDFRAVVNELDVPEDNQLTFAEMHNLLATHRSLSAGGNNWHLWLLVGSRMNGTLGIMFDTGNAPHREGAVGFYDPVLPNLSIIQAAARGKKLGEVPLAYLRTLIHEAGHAFNLFHPKHDVHSPPIGTTIMNQTGDVMGFATTSNPYPCNATMAFNDHNRTSLIHSPDPQVKPGWKEFGWGHGSAWSGIAEPVDAAGLDEGDAADGALKLDLEVPANACRGDFVVATVRVTNTGDSPAEVSAALNLAEDDLKISARHPNGDRIAMRDVVVVCGERRKVTLDPGQSIEGQVQLFYSSLGLTFDQPGRYELQAEFNVGDEHQSVLRSAPASIVVRSASAEDEIERERLTMDAGVGLSLALGDFADDAGAREKLSTVVDRFGDSDTGAACAIVVANSLLREMRDVRGQRVVRSAEKPAAEKALDVALKGRNAAGVARLAAAVVSARDVNAPVLEVLEKRLKKARKGSYSADDLKQASKVLADHLA